jgi:hypothetical protein
VSLNKLQIKIRGEKFRKCIIYYILSDTAICPRENANKSHTSKQGSNEGTKHTKEKHCVKERSKKKKGATKKDKRKGGKKGKREQIKNTKGTMLSMCRSIFTVTHWLMYKECVLSFG